jgi:hypothetical protein
MGWIVVGAPGGRGMEGKRIQVYRSILYLLSSIYRGEFVLGIGWIENKE